MPEDSITVPPGLTTEGLLGRRYLARLIDWVIVSILATVVLSGFGHGLRAHPVSLTTLLIDLVLLVAWVGYGALLESSQWQATIGKELMGLQVYDSRGGRLKPAHAAWRNSVKEGPFVLLALLPAGGILCLAWIAAHLVVMHRSPVYQAIHDRVAKTWVAAPEATTQLHIA